MQILLPLLRFGLQLLRSTMMIPPMLMRHERLLLLNRPTCWP
jgi:hypothetical protein